MRIVRSITSLALLGLASACGSDEAPQGGARGSSDSALQAELKHATVDSAGGNVAPAAAAPVARAPVTAPVPGAESGCDSEAASEQRRCLMAHIARNDAGLNAAYRSVVDEMKRQSPPAADGREPEVVRKLRAQERAWLEYRDTQCLRRTRDKEGPLWAPVRAQCLGEFSAAREEQLLAALANMRRQGAQAAAP